MFSRECYQVLKVKDPSQNKVIVVNHKLGHFFIVWCFIYSNLDLIFTLDTEKKKSHLPNSRFFMKTHNHTHKVDNSRQNSLVLATSLKYRNIQNKKRSKNIN